MANCSDMDRLVAQLRRCELPSECQVKALCHKGREILLTESNVQPVDTPVMVCGDIHGQFFDLLQLFHVGGNVPDKNYVFMGDYVDRGHHGVETFLYLLALKIRYPDRITLMRGNHEARSASKHYGFYDECLRKYGTPAVWYHCTQVFDYLPLSVIIDGRILCVHGGLSPYIKQLDDIRTLNRQREVPQRGPMSDLLWSDPSEQPGWTASPRGVGVLFGGDVTKRFMEQNNISLICRAHQLVMQGFKWDFNKSLLTVWSAPNYCYRFGNVAAILELNEYHQHRFTIFKEATLAQRPMPPTEKRRFDYFV